jgi:hypothetical protein
MGVGVFTMITMWGSFPFCPLFLGANFRTAVTKNKNPPQSVLFFIFKVCKSRHILMKKMSEVSIFRQ